MTDDADALSRRRFIGLATAAGTFAVVGCSDDGTAPSAAPADGATSTSAPPAVPAEPAELVVSDYWDLARQARDAVRESPDHVPAELDRLAAAGDVAGMVDYARAHFAVVPGAENGWVAPGTAQRYGPRGLARSRVGTHREIAQLLTDVLNRNGVETTVVTLPLLDDLRPVLVPADAAPFAPDIAVEAFEAAAEIETPADPVPLDVTAAEAMADAALAALGPDFATAPAVPDLFGQSLPGLAVDGVVVDPWSASPAAIDDGRPPTAAIGTAPEARFSVSITTDREPDRPEEVVSASVPLDRLAGRRVDVRFLPPATDLVSLLSTRPADVTTFVPYLGVEGVDVDAEADADLVVTGTPITIEGDLLVDDGDGFTLAGNRITGDGDASEVADVVVGHVTTGAWPRLGVAVELLGGDGRPVDGVGADAFRVNDGGTAVPLLVRHTEPAVPQVVFIVDNSSSVPAQFRGEGATAVVGAIADAIQAAAPDARFRVANVGATGAARLPWRDDPSEVAADANQFGVGSALWNSYVDGVADGGTVAVFLTDGGAIDADENPQDVAPPDLVAALRSGPPAIMLGTGELGAAFTGIAEITGGVALDIEDPDAAVAAVLAEIDRLRPSYELLVLADETGGDGDRELSVDVGTAGATTSYTVPATEDTPPGPSLAGIHLTVTANGATVTRTLAGAPIGAAVERSAQLELEMRQALFGAYSVITEAGAPSPSQLLDDALTSILTWEPFFTTTDDDERIAAFADARDLPFGAFTFAAPISGPDLLTWETGLRMWLSTERWLPAGDDEVIARRSLDLLPTSRFLTATDDAATSAQRTARRTAWLSGLEDLLFDTAALERLDAPLVALSAAGLDPAARERFDRIAAGGSVYSGYAGTDRLDAAVSVDRQNGTTIALLPDGSGGAQTEESIKTSFKQVIALVEMAESAGAPGAWAKLEKAKLEKLRFATLTIFRMSVEGIIDLLEDEACKLIDKKVTAWGLAGVTRIDGDAAGMLGFAIDRAKLINRYGDAVALPVGLPTKLKVC
ncbi:MAG: hypothetical protein AAF548_08880 [Actinomycetota bacterium]